MPLHAIPVVLPFRMRTDDDAAIHSVHLEAVATAAPAARATAKVIARTIGLLHFGRPPAELLVDRIQIGAPRQAIRGCYCYVFGSSNRVPHLQFPARIEGDAANDFDHLLAGLRHEQVSGVVFDAAQLQSITSAGLAALARHAGPLGMHICRLPPRVEHLLQVSGVAKVLALHTDLPSALDALIHTNRSPIMATAQQRSS